MILPFAKREALRDKSPTRVPAHAVLGSVRAGFQKTQGERLIAESALAPRPKERAPCPEGAPQPRGTAEGGR
jgi:hypothetical protein